MVNVCFVCLGNICRSPTAEGVMLSLVAKAELSESVEIDSAGTGGWHVGELPDPRASATAKARGLSLSSRARQFLPSDFQRFDYIVAMDKSNRRNLCNMNSAFSERVYLLRNFDPTAPRDADVPDPYYGGEQGFDEVFDMCTRACEGLLQHIIKAHRLPTA